MKKNRYFIVGLFIILATTAMIIIGFWLAFGLQDIKYNTYIAKFKESVGGLNVNAPINYNGVNIGKVAGINIDRKNPSIVIVTMQIEEKVPIFSNTYAALVPQGITGQVFISLSIKHQKPAKLIAPRTEPPFPIVQTKASFLTNIVNQMSVVADQVTRISQRVEQIVSDDNVKKVNQILDSLNVILKNTAKSSQKFDQTLNQINQAMQSLSTTSAKVGKITDTLQTQTLQGINNYLLPQLGQTLSEVNQSASTLNQLLSKVSQNPSVLIRGEQIKPSSVEEPQS